MDDLISRQAVMDCFKKWQPYMATRLYEFEKELTAIPSVENKSDPIECARTLRQHCIDAKNCKGCFMLDECKYELSAPCDWDLPDEEKGSE